MIGSTKREKPVLSKLKGFSCLLQLNFSLPCRKLLYFYSILLLIIRLLKEYVANNDFQAVNRIVDCLGKDFANAPHPQPRNGGLIGLAACSIALGKVTIAYLSLVPRLP